MRANTSILTLVVFAGVVPLASLLGCEGEPPMVPENRPGTVAVVGRRRRVGRSCGGGARRRSADRVPAAARARPSPSPSARRPPRERCVRRGGSAAALPVPPPAVPRGNIIGTVTTMPAALQGQAVVYLEDGPKEDSPSRLQTVDHRQPADELHPVRRAWSPRAARSSSPTSDPFPHNVFSPDDEKFNMGNIPQHGAHARCSTRPGALLAALQPAPGDARVLASSRRRRGGRGPTPRGSSS